MKSTIILLYFVICLVTISTAIPIQEIDTPCNRYFQPNDRKLKFCEEAREN